LSGPPLGSTFSLGDRPAPGLYAGAWLLTFVGFGLFAVALAGGMSGSGVSAGAFAVLAFAVLFLAAVLGSGYQALARRATRDPARYRGPSPFLVFGAVFAGASAVATALALTGLAATLSDTEAVLLSVLVIVLLYAGLVWLLVVREGALSWAEMGWPAAPGRAAATVSQLAFGVLVAAPIVVLTVVFGGLLAAFFEVTPPSLLPVPSTLGEWLLDVAIVVVVAPAGEELFFRGFAQTAWSRDLGGRAALVRSALFFAMIHAFSTTGTDLSEALRLVVVATVARLPVAFTLGWVFARTGSIAAPIGLHAAFNGLSLIIAAVIGSALT